MIVGVGEGVLHMLLLPPPFGNVSEYQHDPGDFALLVADRGGTVVNGSFRAVFGDEQRVVRQPDDHALPQGSDGGALDRLATLFIDDLEDGLQWTARRLSLRPAGQEFSDRVQEGDPPVGIGGDDRIANAGERWHGTTPAESATLRQSAGEGRSYPTPSCLCSFIAGLPLSRQVILRAVADGPGRPHGFLFLARTPASWLSL